MLQGGFEMICTNCSSEVQVGSRFCSACGVRLTPAYVPVQEAASREGLYRSREGRMIAGVCAGFARRYGWDVVIVRLLLVLTVLVGCGMPILLYIVGWFVMPKEPYAFAVATPVVPEPVQPQV
jgi:phage shock protein C